MLKRWPRVGTVVFDCDSTLTSIEGIQQLAGDHQAEVARLTAAVMAGDLPLEKAYGRRLELVRPDRSAVERLGATYVAALVPDAREVVAALQEEGIGVAIVSGGVRQAVLEVGRALGVPEERVAAVALHFAADGTYTGYDTASPLARAGGKRELLQAWRAELTPPLMLVGDGATDLEARSVVDVFVAYAGVAERTRVVAGADAVIHTRSLAPVLPLALGGEAPRRSTASPLYEKGRRLQDLEPSLELDQSNQKETR